MSEPTNREKELGYCEEAQTYCSVAEDRYKLGYADGSLAVTEEIMLKKVQPMINNARNDVIQKLRKQPMSKIEILVDGKHIDVTDKVHRMYLTFLKMIENCDCAEEEDKSC